MRVEFLLFQMQFLWQSQAVGTVSHCGCDGVSHPRTVLAGNTVEGLCSKQGPVLSMNHSTCVLRFCVGRSMAQAVLGHQVKKLCDVQAGAFQGLKQSTPQCTQPPPGIVTFEATPESDDKLRLATGSSLPRRPTDNTLSALDSSTNSDTHRC